MNAPRSADRRAAVVVVGGGGEFGRFLQEDILPGLGVKTVSVVERETTRTEQDRAFRQAGHVVLATPLAGYAERACALVDQVRDVASPTTLWLIPSVQAGVWRAVTAMLAEAGNPWLSAVFVHPMYGPNGFRAHDQGARTFQNILAGTWEGAWHPIRREVAAIAGSFWRAFHIATTAAFDAEAHDRITACSQGLSYCVASTMFEQPILDARVRAALPDLHHAFHANRALIHDFLRLNACVLPVQAVFDEAWRTTGQATFADLLAAFARADAVLNGDAPSPIPTKWYEKLRATARPGL